MYTYNVDDLLIELNAIIQQNLAAPVWDLLIQSKPPISKAELYAAFAMMPRKTGKTIINISEKQQEALQTIRPSLQIKGWTIDRLCRVKLLLQLDATKKDDYTGSIEDLFLAAEMNEQVALYSALPLLAWPEHWHKRCAEGIRSNIGDVLQAIMCNNPYPSEYLSDSAWNQMVLKAFFTEKPVEQIIGLDERANKELAKILCDYAHERWAAHRLVNPLLWRCVGYFIDKEIYPDIEKIAHSENPLERKAAMLACSRSNYPPAKTLLQKMAYSSSPDEEEKKRWDSLAQEAKAVAL